MATIHAPTVCFDLKTISNYFRSCARMIAIRNTTHTEWTEYRDSAVLNAIYTVFFWKGAPGTVEIKDGTAQEIDEITDTWHEKFLTHWLDKLATQGPAAAMTYANSVANMRKEAMHDLDQLYENARSINSDIIGETQQGIRNLALIKLGAQIGVAVIGGVAGVALVGGTAGATVMGLQLGAGSSGYLAFGIANAVVSDMVSTWEDSPRAKVVGFVTGSSGTAALGAVIGPAIDNLIEDAGKREGQAMKQGDRALRIMRQAEIKIERYAAQLADETLRLKQRRAAANHLQTNMARAGQHAAKVETAYQGAARAGSERMMATGLGKSLPVVFAALDIRNAIADYNKTVASTR